MVSTSKDPVISQILIEEGQSHITRKNLFIQLENLLKLPVLSFFTSFNFPVSIEDSDASMLEGLLQKMDLSKGLVLIINSPGGDGLAAERIVNICRSYSGIGEYEAIVPGKAKSAATIICFGAKKILMGTSSELGPVDPQLTIKEEETLKRFSIYNLINSYDGLFSRAVRSKGNLEPFLQQLQRYDERDIKEYRSALAFSEDLAIKCLSAGMLKGQNIATIKKNISIFLTPKQTKVHGRPIYRDEAKKCGLDIEFLDINSNLWKLLYELYIRTDNYVTSKVSKCFESKTQSFIVRKPS